MTGADQRAGVRQLYASTVFYERLLRVVGWQELPLTEAAQQAVRRA